VKTKKISAITKKEAAAGERNGGENGQSAKIEENSAEESNIEI